MKPKDWALNVLIGLDQFANAVIRGDPDETISSRAAKAELRGKKWGCLLCKFLDKLDKDHCQKSLEKDEGRPGF
jgi:hypothetical protein